MIFKNSEYKECLPEAFSIIYKKNCTEKAAFHLHDQMEVVFSLTNNLQCRFENTTVDIPQNGFIILDSNVLHHIIPKNLNGPFDRYVLYFNANYVSSFSTSENNLRRCFLKSSIDHNAAINVPEKYIPTIIEQLEHMNNCKMRKCIFLPDEKYCPIHERFLLGEFLLMINRLYDMTYGTSGAELFNEHSTLVYQIYDFVKSNIAQNPSLETISNEFGISKTQIYYIFKEVTGQTLADYVSNYKISIAKDYLINSDKTIDEISYALGYSSISSFSRHFKLKNGISPLQYRKEMNQYILSARN